MAKGSQTTYAGWEPKECCHCGTKLTHKTGALYHQPVVGEPWATCTKGDCIAKGRP